METTFAPTEISPNSGIEAGSGAREHNNVQETIWRLLGAVGISAGELAKHRDTTQEAIVNYMLDCPGAVIRRSFEGPFIPITEAESLPADEVAEAEHLQQFNLSLVHNVTETSDEEAMDIATNQSRFVIAVMNGMMESEQYDTRRVLGTTVRMESALSPDVTGVATMDADPEKGVESIAVLNEVMRTRKGERVAVPHCRIVSTLRRDDGASYSLDVTEGEESVVKMKYWKRGEYIEQEITDSDAKQQYLMAFVGDFAAAYLNYAPEDDEAARAAARRVIRSEI